MIMGKLFLFEYNTRCNNLHFTIFMSLAHIMIVKNVQTLTIFRKWKYGLGLYEWVRVHYI